MKSKFNLLPYIILILSFLIIGKVKGQIVLTKFDTVSDGAGSRINVEWSDSNPLSTEWTISMGGSASYQIGGDQMQLTPNITTSPKYLLTSSNSRIYGWGCFGGNYIKTAWLEIRSNTGTYYGALMPVPSNYVVIGCKGISTLGQTLTSTGVNLMWDWYTISGKTEISYSYDGGTITTVNSTCSAYSLKPNGKTANVTVTVTCPDGSKSSKTTNVDLSSFYTAPSTTTTPTKKGKK